MVQGLHEIERIFLAFSDRTRIRLAGLMRNGEVTVNYLCEATGESQPKVSRHLAYLRSMGMVNTRRDGKWIYYCLAEPGNRYGSRLLHDTLDWIANVTEDHEGTVDPQFEKPVAPRVADVIRKDPNTYGYQDVRNDKEELEIYLL
jgi:DNA-binding transcriptional ArsR family regulator